MATEADDQLAQRLDRLFEIVRRPDGGVYSNQAVAEAITESGTSISRIYLWQLRTGVKDNPTKRHLQALADFFDVPIAYFFDGEQGEEVRAEIELLKALRDGNVRALALRANGLSPESLRAIAALVENARQIEGLESQA